MKILVACEESGIVTQAFRERGHEAYSCDILKTSGGNPQWRIVGDVLPLLNGNMEFIVQSGIKREIRGRWDIIIAHPPCTYLSNAAAVRLYPQKGVICQGRYQKGLLAKEFFMTIWNADCDKIAIENPISSKVFEMPPHTQQIEPYQFYGALHPYTKKTRLWLKNLPLLVPVEPVEPIGSFLPAGTSRKDKSKYGYAKRGDDRKNRSKTFAGLARAMSEQWGGD